MKKATGTPLESDYGFKSPSFSVDALGNIIANSISTTEPIGGGGDGDVVTATSFIITENETNSAFLFSGVEGSSPNIELSRGTTYSFQLQLEDLSFFVYQSDGTTIFPNIVDDQGNTGVLANGKSTGIIQLTISAETDDTLIYANADKSVTGFFTIVNPTGSFGSIRITNTTQSTSTTTGSLRVAGGVGIAKDLYVGGNLVMEGTGDVKFDNTTNLTLGAGNRIIFTIDSTLIGEVNEDGFKTPLNNTTINNTTIGETTPSTAKFTSAEVSESPTTVNNVTNKAYVDQQDIALSIALGS
jgi:hypothetical protein